jgi:phospholipase/carboxylesterase
LVGVAGEWISLLGAAAEQFRFVFPAAPLSLAELGLPDGRAWWPLNMSRLMEAVEAKQFDELHQHEPPGIDRAREQLCETIQLVQQELGGTKRLVLGGFSQGAMLTMETSLRGTIDPPEVLIQFSGTVVCEPHWQSAMPRLSNTRVYQSHGQIDPILPFASAERLQELLSEGKVNVDFHSFMGPHTIDPVAIDNTAQALRACV